jgi:hypothetical protein
VDAIEKGCIKSAVFKTATRESATSTLLYEESQIEPLCQKIQTRFTKSFKYD